MNNLLAACAMLYFDKAQYEQEYRLNSSGEKFIELLGDSNLTRFFSVEWVSKSMTISPAAMDLTETNKILSCSDFEVLFKRGQIPIGSFRNGDILVVALESPHPVGIVSHDSLWEDQRLEIAQMDCCLELFLIRIAERRFIPIDYYQCRDLNEITQKRSPVKRKRKKTAKRR